MTTRLERNESGATTTDRSPPDPRGTWTIDPAASTVCFAWRMLRLWTNTGRRPCLGVIHLDELPPTGVIRFGQPSGLPVLTMASDPASLEPGDADRQQQRWWTLHSHSLEILPGGAWRVMATLTTHRTQGLVELRMEVDLEQSHDWLVLRGWGVLDRQAFASGIQAWSFDPTVRLELAVHATWVETHPPSVPSLALAGRVSGMSAPEQDRVSVQADPRRGTAAGQRTGPWPTGRGDA